MESELSNPESTIVGYTGNLSSPWSSCPNSPWELDPPTPNQRIAQSPLSCREMLTPETDMSQGDLTLSLSPLVVATSGKESLAPLVDLSDLPPPLDPMQDLADSLLPGTYRLRTNHLFLTYPKCPLSPERVMESLKKKFEKKVIRYVVVAQEYHGDGTLHIHALVILGTALDTVNARFADIDGYHGNYRSAKYPVAVERYVKKGGSYLTHGSRDVLREAKSKDKKELISLKLATEICNGHRVSSLISKPIYRSYCLTRTRALLQYQDLVLSANIVEMPPLPKIKSALEGNALLVSNWLLENFSGRPKALRSPQLYLYGPPRMGKTLFCQVLSSSKKTYFPSIGEKYFDGYDDSYELIVFDEGLESHPLTEILQILDGQRMRLPQRYQAFMKTKNVPVIICSNLPPEERYPNCHPDRKIALRDRLLVVNVTEFLDVFDVPRTC